MVQAVERAVALLERLDRAGAGGATLGELSSDTGLKPPTARGLLVTLEALGYVRQSAASRRYRLGDGARDLGRRESLVSRLTRAGAAPVAAARERTGETVLLAVYRDGRRHTLVTEQSPHALRVGSNTGVDDHFYATATGRLLLSLLNPDELTAAVARLGPPDADWPEAGGADLARELARIRAAGVARFRARDRQVHALAVPVPLEDGDVPAAVGAYLPAARYDAVRDGEILAALRETAAVIAAEYERMTS